MGAGTAAVRSIIEETISALILVCSLSPLLRIATGSTTKPTTVAARGVMAATVTGTIAKSAISGSVDSANMHIGASSFTLTGRTGKIATTEANGEGEKEAEEKEKARDIVVVVEEKEGRAKARNGGRSAHEVIRKIAPNLKRMHFQFFWSTSAVQSRAHA